jgi:hypothetical protein
VTKKKKSYPPGFLGFYIDTALRQAAKKAFETARPMARIVDGGFEDDVSEEGCGGFLQASSQGGQKLMGGDGKRRLADWPLTRAARTHRTRRRHIGLAVG